MISGALARAGSFLLDPPVEGPRAVEPAAARFGPRWPVVAVVGLTPGCGATTVARALAVELAGRSTAHAAAVTASLRPGAFGPGYRGAARLARELAGDGGPRARAIGCLCLLDACSPAVASDRTGGRAPLALDTDPASAPAAAAVADHVLVVAASDGEPALAEVVAAALARVGPEPIVVLNRARDLGAWTGRASVVLPDAPAGARLARAGREPLGALGKAIAELADLWEGLPCR